MVSRSLTSRYADCFFENGSIYCNWREQQTIYCIDLAVENSDMSGRGNRAGGDLLRPEASFILNRRFYGSHCVEPYPELQRLNPIGIKWLSFGDKRYGDFRRRSAEY